MLTGRPQMRGQETRAAILTAVEMEPGIHQTALCQNLGIGWGTVTYHIHILQSQGRIRARRDGPRTLRLFPAEAGERMMRWIGALRNDAELIMALHEKPGAGVCELAEMLSRDRKLIRRHLDLMDKDGIIVVAGGRRAKYRLAPSVVPLAKNLGDEVELPPSIHRSLEESV